MPIAPQRPSRVEPSDANFHSLSQRFGATVRWFRGQRGLTQRELAARTGLQRSYLADVERGGRHVSLTNLARIAAGAGVPLSAFFARMETITPDDADR